MMLRTIGRLTPAGIFSIGRENSEYDKNRLNDPPGKVPETGIDRVKAMFSTDQFGQPSVQLHYVTQSSLTGAFIGAAYGGFIHSRLAYLYFIENNEATIFKSTNEAKKKLQDFVTVAFCRGAVKWGWRLGAFTGIFSLTAAMVSAYRGDTSIMEYVAAGTITGALYKANLGLRASLVGAGLANLSRAVETQSHCFFPECLAKERFSVPKWLRVMLFNPASLWLLNRTWPLWPGAILSAVGGAAICGIISLAGCSMDDIRQALSKIKKAREDQMNQAMEKASEIKNDSLTKHHDVLVEQKGVITIDKI